MDKPQEEITLLLAEIAAGSLAQWCAPDIDKFLKMDLDFLLNLRWARGLLHRQKQMEFPPARHPRRFRRIGRARRLNDGRWMR